MAAAAEPSACVLYECKKLLKTTYLWIAVIYLGLNFFKNKIPLSKMYFKTYIIFALDSGKNAIVIESRKESFYSPLK